MQGFLRAARSFRDTMKQATNLAETKNVLARLRCVTSSPVMHQKGLENTTVAEVLISKGDESPGSWLWCRSNDTVHDAVKQMAKHNVGSLVVLKPGEQNLIAGIVTERDYLNKIIANERPPKTTSVGEIMTDEKKLIMMSSDTNILQAMQLMTENQIRHVPVIDGKMVGMVSIEDVVRKVVELQTREVQQLNQFIKGDYY
uniref:CBS domain-containing protein n=1 Tax=Kalanchoe fedtschenkoi TaxID=63787 RepID=A0A7N0V616_KALFE